MLISYDVFGMKIVIDRRIKSKYETCITSWWSGGNLHLMISRIQLWNKRDRDRMLNGEDVKIWCFWDENGNWF